jgi:hypothetical protein
MVEGCDGAHTARGYCSTHYQNLRRTGSPVAQIRRKLKPRIVDVLESDGGWLTVQGINLVLPDMVEESIIYCLRTLARDGTVERRQIGLAGSVGPVGYEIRNEWRIA